MASLQEMGSPAHCVHAAAICEWSSTTWEVQARDTLLVPTSQPQKSSSTKARDSTNLLNINKISTGKKNVCTDSHAEWHGQYLNNMYQYCNTTVNFNKDGVALIKTIHMEVVRRRNKKLKEGYASESVHSEMWQQQ